MTLIRDCLWWLWCFTAFHAYTRLPWPMVRGKFGLWLLPASGAYAYGTTWAHFRDCAKRRWSA